MTNREKIELNQSDEISESSPIINEGVINYVSRERRYLFFAVLVPFLSLPVNILNLRLIIIAWINNLLPIERLIDISLPLELALVLSIFMWIQLGFLHRWRKMYQQYTEHKREKVAMNNAENGPSLTNLFYSIVEHMEKGRIIFYIIGVIFIIYALWGLDFFFIGFPNSIPSKIYRITWWANVFAYALNGIYIIQQALHFLNWNKKIKKISELEKATFMELRL